MEQMHIAKLEDQEARQLADAVSVFQDLSFVLDVLTRLRVELQKHKPDGILIQAYWTGALVTYVRCFSTGKRAVLSESVFEGVHGPEHSAVEVHRHFKALRDKHIAHSVNPFEQVEVGAILSPPGATDRKVEGIGTFSMRLISTDVEGVDSLHELARIARQKTATECERLKQATQAVAENLDLEQLYKTATLRTVAPPPGQADQPRP